MERLHRRALRRAPPGSSRVTKPTSSSSGSTGMKVRTLVDTAQQLHARPFPDSGDPELWICRPEAPALVIGSSQRPEQFDRQALASAGIELATRRSGGGAVWIDPEASVWIDLLAPKASPWYHDDLVETFRIAGRRWLAALSACRINADIVDKTDVGPSRSQAASLVCWAGLGWGEITVNGAKIVGLSQRRTRWGARIQGLAVVDGSPNQAADWFSAMSPAQVGELHSLIGSEPLSLSTAQLEAEVVAAFARA